MDFTKRGNLRTETTESEITTETTSSSDQAPRDPHAPIDDDEESAWLRKELHTRFALSPTLQAALLARPAPELAALAIRALEKGDDPAALLITMVTREQRPTSDELARGQQALTARAWPLANTTSPPPPETLDGLMAQATARAATQAAGPSYIDLIDAWRDALPVPPAGYAYSEANRRWAEQMFEDWNITAKDVRAFVTEKHSPQADGFWLDKAMSFQHVYRTIRVWKHGRTAATTAREPLPPPDPDCPTCHGQGIVLPNVPPDHPKYNQPVPCPVCRGKVKKEIAVHG